VFFWSLIKIDYTYFTFTKIFLEKKIHTDTIELPKVYRKHRNTGQYAHLSLGYYQCVKICNGYISDYYRNGKLRLEGHFENRIPKNEIKKYDTRGKLIVIEIYNTDAILKDAKYPD